MASFATPAAGPVWKRLLDWFTAFAEAAEMDSATLTEQRIQNLERRIADLERVHASGFAANAEDCAVAVGHRVLPASRPRDSR